MWQNIPPHFEDSFQFNTEEKNDKVREAGSRNQSLSLPT